MRQEGSEYLGRLGELLAVLPLNLLQPAVGLQREEGGGVGRRGFGGERGRVEEERGREGVRGWRADGRIHKETDWRN